MPTTKQLATQGRVIMIIQGELHLRGVHDVTTHEIANRMGPRLKEMADDITKVADEIHLNKFRSTWETRDKMRSRLVWSTILGCTMVVLGMLGIVLGDAIFTWLGLLLLGGGLVIVIAQLQGSYDPYRQ